jgi:hypothetical protein
MYIEFKLPDGPDAFYTADDFRTLVRQEMQNWSQRYSIAYREKTIKYTVRFTFDRDEFYSFWNMTWNPGQDSQLSRYRMVIDLNNKI